MNRSHLWKFLIIVFVVVWAIYEATPLTSRDLLREFQRKSHRQASPSHSPPASPFRPTCEASNILNEVLVFWLAKILRQKFEKSSRPSAPNFDGLSHEASGK
jgi:hypothetical protein